MKLGTIRRTVALIAITAAAIGLQPARADAYTIRIPNTLEAANLCVGKMGGTAHSDVGSGQAFCTFG